MWENWRAQPGQEKPTAQIESQLNQVCAGYGTHRVELDARYADVERYQYIVWNNGPARISLEASRMGGGSGPKGVLGQAGPN